MKFSAIAIATVFSFAIAATKTNAFVHLVPPSITATSSSSLTAYVDLDAGISTPVLANPLETDISVQELSSDLTSKQLIKKPRVLFFHGEYTNEKVASHLLSMTGFDTLFDFVVPPAMYKGSPCPEELRDGLELSPMIKKGMYPLDGDYFKWGGRYELMEEDPSSFKETDKEMFQTDLKKYIAQIDKQYGPFDGLMGFCEGGAALNTIIGMKEQGELGGALDSAKFFVHMAPWVTPLGDKYATSPKDMPTLTVAGTNDFDAFKKANSKYGKGFTGYFDQYSHDGKHNYPFVNDDLSHKLLSLVDKSTVGFLVDNWELVIEDDETISPVSITEELKATCLDFIAEISGTDTDDFTPQTTVFDGLEFDSLDVVEFFCLLQEFKEESEEFDGEKVDTSVNERRIFDNRDSATVQHLLDEAAMILSSE